MSFPPGTEMFQFPGFASAAYGFSGGYSLRSGLPHSEILGSKPARGSPRLFAACHVLHRLLAPRHPPDALAFLGPHQRQPQPPPQADDRRGPRRGAQRRRREGMRRPSPGTIPATTALQSGRSLRRSQQAASIPMPDARPAADGKKEGQARATCRRPPHHDARTWIAPRPMPARRAPRHHLTMSKEHTPCPAQGPAARDGAASGGRARPGPRRPHLPQGKRGLVGLGRLERPTSRLSGVRSNQLSYRPKSRGTEPEPDSHPTRASAPARPEGCVRRDVQTAAGD